MMLYIVIAIILVIGVGATRSIVGDAKGNAVDGIVSAVSDAAAGTGTLLSKTVEGFTASADAVSSARSDAKGEVAGLWVVLLGIIALLWWIF
jgi:hypothetical protein